MERPLCHHRLYGFVAVFRSYLGRLCLSMPHKLSAVVPQKEVARKSIKGRRVATNKYSCRLAASLHRQR